VTGGRRLLILPDCNRSAVSCSPLEGDCRPPRRRTANRTRKGPVFFLRCAPEEFMLLACWRRCLRGGRSRSTLFPPGNARGRQMAWSTPTLVEICIGLEINGSLPAEFCPRRNCANLNGRPVWHSGPRAPVLAHPGDRCGRLRLYLIIDFSARNERSIHDDAPDALALVHQLESLVDVRQRHGVRDHRVDFD